MIGIFTTSLSEAEVLSYLKKSTIIKVSNKAIIKHLKEDVTG